MNKICLLALGLFLITSTLSDAEIFRCRTADGKLVMSDQQDKLPANCRPVDKPGGAGEFNVMPANNNIGDKRRSVSPAQRPIANNEDLTAMQNAATDMVQSYRDAVRRRYRSSYTTDQRAAMREITELGRRKESMLDRLPRSGLTVSDQQSIRKILDEIPKQ